MATNLKLLEKNRAGLLVIDMQKKLLKTMQHPDLLVENVLKLIEGFKVFNQPIFLTEQNPEKLGKTDTTIKKALKNIEVQEKWSFSCCGIKGFPHLLRTHQISQTVLCGIESHICVWQTAMDLSYDQFEVVVAGDAVSSRKEIDKTTILNRMLANSIQVSTVETILFELLKQAETDELDKISEIIK